MAFAWSPPALSLQNGEITNYTLTCEAAAQATASVTTNLLQFTLDTFIPGVGFECSIYATNQFGNGPSTDAIVVITPSKTSSHAHHLLAFSAYKLFKAP